MLTPPVVLIVDDEARLRESLTELLSGRGYRVLEAADGEAALELVNPPDLPDVIVLDLKMPKRDGLSTLIELRKQPETCHIPVVIITAFGDSEQTITAMKAGAYDYITKPFDAEEVCRTAARAVEVSRLSREVEQLRARAATWSTQEPGLIGRHPAMREVFKKIGRVATSDATVLITGESGTGKELVARAVHRHSPRAHSPFLAINCAAIPEGLLESELFGYERGAFTGAVQAKLGKLELASGGTVFLDEIGDLPLVLQGKLLRVLQERTIDRLGGHHARSVDFRLLTATNRDLQRLLTDGRFREDLFYRLNVVEIKVPPLRARRSDIPELVEYFLEQCRTGRPEKPLGVTDGALRTLLLYDFPGNVRELAQIIQRAALLVHGPLITQEDLEPLIPSPGNAETHPMWQALLTLPLEDAVRGLERFLITRALVRTQGNKAEAARLLGIHRQQLYVKLKELRIGPQEWVPSSTNENPL